MNHKCHQNNIEVAYSYRQEVQKELLNSLPTLVLTTTQSGKIVRTAAAMLKLNLLECSLLAWLLKKSKYQLVDLTSSAQSITMFQDDQNKQLMLLILLNAYYAKSFLTNNSNFEIDAQIVELIPNFNKIYRSWRPDVSLSELKLGQLNDSFDSWSLPQRRIKPDYNQLVNKILQLSKTYNVGGNEQQPPKKKRKINDQNQLEINQKEDQMLHSYTMRLRSSRGDDRGHNNTNNAQIWELDQANNNNDIMRRSTPRNNYASGFFNFDMTDSRQLFNSRPNINQSLVRTRSRNLIDDKTSKAKIKLTTSYQELK